MPPDPHPHPTEDAPAMPDMSTQEVRVLLRALDLAPLDDVDLDEITHRVNAINEAVADLEDPDADAVEPIPIFWLAAEEQEEAADGR